MCMSGWVCIGTHLYTPTCFIRRVLYVMFRCVCALKARPKVCIGVCGCVCCLCMSWVWVGEGVFVCGQCVSIQYMCVQKIALLR